MHFLNMLFSKHPFFLEFFLKFFCNFSQMTVYEDILYMLKNILLYSNAIIEVSFNTSLGCFLEFGRVKLDLADLLVSGYAFVQTLQIFVHNGFQVIRLVQSQRVECFVVGINQCNQFLVALYYKALQHERQVVKACFYLCLR